MWFHRSAQKCAIRREKGEGGGGAWFSTRWRMSVGVWYFQHSFPYPDRKWSRLGWPSGRRCLADGDPMSVSPIEVVSYLATLKPPSNVKLPFALLAFHLSFFFLFFLFVRKYKYIFISRLSTAAKWRVLKLGEGGGTFFLRRLDNSPITESRSQIRRKLFHRQCRIIRVAVPRARIRNNPGVLHCIITCPLHYCISGESEANRAPVRARIGRADGRRLNLGLKGGMKIQFDVQSPNFRHVYVSKLPPRYGNIEWTHMNCARSAQALARRRDYIFIYTRDLITRALGGPRWPSASMMLNVIILADNK